MTTNQQVELEVLKTNLAAGTCNGKPASGRQQQVRRRRIREIEGV